MKGRPVPESGGRDGPFELRTPLAVGAIAASFGAANDDLLAVLGLRDKSEQVGPTYQATGKIPSGRTLAKELGVNISTINLALSELRSAGIVRRQARKGTFVVSEDERREAQIPMTARLVCGASTRGPEEWYLRVRADLCRARPAHGPALRPDGRAVRRGDELRL